MRIVYLDLETDGLLEEATRVVVGVTLEEKNPEVPFIWGDDSVEFMAEEEGYRYGGNIHDLARYLFNNADIVVAHNGIGHDFPCFRKFGVTPNLSCLHLGDVIHDTLYMSRMCYPDMMERDKQQKMIDKTLWGRHSLKAWGARFKDDKGDYDGPWDQLSVEMTDYCIQDVKITRRLYHHLSKHPFNVSLPRAIEHQVGELIQMQIENGFCFDSNQADTLIHKLEVRKGQIDGILDQSFPPSFVEMATPEYWEDTATGNRYPTKAATVKAAGNEMFVKRGPNKIKTVPFNPDSRKQIGEAFVQKYGWEPKHYTPSGQIRIDESVLASLPYPEAPLLNERLTLEKRLGQIKNGKNAWVNLVNPRTGAIHGYVNTLGARTHRMTHSRPNVAQVPSIYAPYGADCRACFTARDGWLLVGADAAGLEARCLAHYMATFDGGEFTKIVTEGDLHQVNADTWGLERNDAKAPFYGMIYGAGPAKLGSMVGGDKARGKEIMEAFEKRFPAYKKLKTEVELAACTGKIKSLDGRYFYIELEDEPRVERMMVQDGFPNNGVRKAFNTLLQGAGAVIMKYGLVELYNRLLDRGFKHQEDFAFCGNIHDEWQIEAKPDIAEIVGDQCVQAIRNVQHELNLNCPLDGEYRVGHTWKDTH